MIFWCIAIFGVVLFGGVIWSEILHERQRLDAQRPCGRGTLSIDPNGRFKVRMSPGEDHAAVTLTASSDGVHFYRVDAPHWFDTAQFADATPDPCGDRYDLAAERQAEREDRAFIARQRRREMRLVRGSRR